MEAHEVRAYEILKRAKPPCRGAEIGVAVGTTSACLLSNPGVSLIMVDSWAEESQQSEAYRNSGDWHAHCTAEEQQAHYEHAIKDTEFAKDRRTVYRMDSLKAAALVPDASLDFVFLDGDHSYEGCANDIDAWTQKVRPGGWIGGHDYGHVEELQKPWTWGVKRAVDEAVALMGWQLELGGNYTWFVRL